MDEEKKEQQKQEEQDSTKKALKTGAKAAANAYAGPVGGKVVDLASKTKLGNTILDQGAKQLNKNPMMGKLANTANKSGALDAADKGLDAANGGGLGGKENPLKDKKIKVEGEVPKEEKNSNQSSGFNSLFSNNGEEQNEDDSSESLFGFEGSDSGGKKKKTLLFVLLSLALLVVCFILLVVSLLIHPLDAAVEYLSLAGDASLIEQFIGIFKKDAEEKERKQEKKYYDKLKEIQNKVRDEKGVCIDINLINATLTIGRNMDILIEDLETEGAIDREIISNEDGSVQGAETLQYNKMMKQIELLAHMQIMTNKYGFDKKWKQETGSYCKETTQAELVTRETEENFSERYFWQKTNGLDSSKAELIARHDETGFSAFWKKKVDEETNKAYYLYYPEFTAIYDYDSEGNVKLDAQGNPIIKNKTCGEKLPKDSYQLSIGDYKTRESSVYYWNLVNSFIPEYYENHLPKDETEREEKILEIADEIYLLYEDIGPDRLCNINYAYSGSSNLCPNGVTVIAGTNDSGYNKNPDQYPIGTFDFEEYVAMVVKGENNTRYDESMKAQIIAARTYTLMRTNNCTKPIRNSTEDQVARANPSDRIKQLVSETKGQILTYNGKPFSTEYDSFNGTCNGDTCTATYTKQPNGETHIVEIPSSFNEGIGGHGRGMSQCAANYLASIGYTYEQILKYFYSEGVEISTVSGVESTEGATIAKNSIEQILANSGSSIDAFNQYIFEQVKKSGVGTRDGVVAAAISLTSKLHEQTGYILPYELYPSGKYNGYGMDPIWGTNTGRSDYPSHGLDCSGFISWAIHNGGYQYQLINAKGWGNSGVSRSWSKGKTDRTALPGDLIYNAPPSNNGTSGHIRMIVAVENDGYLVAEAGSGKVGVRTTKVSFTSTGSYYLVDMTDYYNDANRLAKDYPG